MKEPRAKRELGKETFIYCDGTEQDVTIHAVPRFARMRLKRQQRVTELDKKGEVKKADFLDDKYVFEVLKLSLGNQITAQDLEELDFPDPKEMYNKYFVDPYKDKEKKVNTSDMQEQNQDKKSEA